MRKFLLTALTLLMIVSAVAQETKVDSKTGAPDFSWARAPYRLTYAIKELDEGKVINTRNYSMTLVSCAEVGPRPSGEVKAGSKVPLASEKGPIYMDVGINLFARLMMSSSGILTLEQNTEITSLAAGPDAPRTEGPGPLLRAIRSSSNTEITAGKPIVITELDDPISKHRFQIEVTATKLR